MVIEVVHSCGENAVTRRPEQGVMIKIPEIMTVQELQIKQNKKQCISLESAFKSLITDTTDFRFRKEDLAKQVTQSIHRTKVF